jgi:hypothetical protein
MIGMSLSEKEKNVIEEAKSYYLSNKQILSERKKELAK